VYDPQKAKYSAESTGILHAPLAVAYCKVNARAQLLGQIEHNFGAQEIAK